MSRIVRAANAMVSSPDKVTNIISKKNEYFFLYKEKYKWSMSYDEGEDTYYLFYYPGDISLQSLSRMSSVEWDQIEYVNYSSSDIGTKEARHTFRELYLLIKEKALGVSEVLDDIISDIEDNMPF